MGDRNILLIRFASFFYLSLLGEDWGLSFNYSSRGRGDFASKWRYCIPILSIRWSMIFSEWMIFHSSDGGDLRVLLGVDL